MDEKQIAFIICTNNPQYYNECVQYIHELTVPDGYSTDIICIQEAPSMAAGYNAGMQASMAKYKVYLHQDTFIMNVNFIGDLLQVFQSDSKVGMIGVIGTTQLSKNSQIFLNWNVGNVEAYDGKQYILSNLIQNPAESFTEVEAVDGLLIATQYDVLWREDILDGWDFYDISAALEMRRLGYKVVVPYQSKPWCYHDCGVSKMKEYDKYRKKVACEYLEIGFQEETDAQEEKRRLEDIQKLEDIFQVLSGLLKIGLLNQVEIYTQKLREIWPLDTRIREMINMMESLLALGHNVTRIRYPIHNYENDENFVEQLQNIILKNQLDIIISFDFFPVVAKAADRSSIKYISWVYDTPHYTLYSPSVLSKWVYLFLFDKTQYLQLSRIKKEHVYHMPLAVNTQRLNKLLKGGEKNISYRDNISFVGSLYENNMYRQIKRLPDYLSGYLDGIIEAQQKIYGYNMMKELLSQEIVSQLQRHVILNMDESYMLTKEQMYADLFSAEVTCRERKRLLEALSFVSPLSLYTNSNMELCSHIQKKGIVSYDKEMPQVFCHSKINVNITLRSIESGIPLRALDIMGAGGFLLSNYQSELAEYFQDGREMVLFDSDQDMLQKAEYYLCHESEREQIALEGWKKVQQEFSYEKQLKKIIDIVQETMD